jgi:hypothetical protein
MADATHANLQVTRNPLASYAELPNGVKYQDRDEGEEIELLLRRHPITNLGWILLTIIGLILPPLLIVLNPSTYIGLEWIAAIPDQVLFSLTLFWYVLVLGFALENFLVWYYNVYLVTTQRLVDVDFIGLLHYLASDAGLEQVQDVSHAQTGVAQLLFGYGNVMVQTAGVKEHIIFERVPNPNRVADIITDLLPRHDASEGNP